MASAVLKMPTPIRPAKHPKPMVCIDDVTMAFGDFVATENVNITVADGEFVSVVGPTGCGKSTILNAVAGLLKPAKGSVTIDGQPVSGIQGDIGYLFQQEALLPWKTAFENVELGLKFGLTSPKPNVPRKSTRGWPRWVWPDLENAIRTSCPAASASAFRWPRP